MRVMSRPLDLDIAITQKLGQASTMAVALWTAGPQRLSTTSSASTIDEFARHALAGVPLVELPCAARWGTVGMRSKFNYRACYIF